MSEAEALARKPAPAVEPKNASAGRTGARVSIRIEKVGVVTDYGKAAAALVAMNHKDFIAEIDRLAQRAANAPPRSSDRCGHEAGFANIISGQVFPAPSASA